MANPEHLEILERGVEAWNEWRRSDFETIPDLDGADFCGYHLRQVDLHGAHLVRAELNSAELMSARFRGAGLREAELMSARLSGADLREADLGGASLCLADLRGVDLRGANLAGASFRLVNLRGANLVGAGPFGYPGEACLVGADLTQAEIGLTTFGNIDLSEVKGLETVHHRGPSTIGIDTIYRSKGKIPEVFLRGCGVPEDFIVYMKSLVGKPIEFYSCFISYSSKDDDFAKRLYADLQAQHVRCWFAPEDLKIGDKFRMGIDEAIRVHDKLLLVLSENSVNSAWVEKEVETAFEKERRQGNKPVLFPIRLDDSVMETDQAWAADIRRTRHIGDFTRWKDHDAYQQAFQRLLRDLKAEQNAATPEFEATSR